MTRKRNNERVRILFSFILSMTFSFSALAQLIEFPLHSHSSSFNRRHASQRIATLQTVNLPFWDDFSYSDTLSYPDENLWVYGKSVFLNSGTGASPPTKNVITFDGIDSIGKPYNVNDILAKGLADKAAPLITAETQVVFYDTYLSGMGFYLRSEKPIWVITHSKKKRTFLGNYYALGKRADLNSRWGKALFDFDEFRDQWQSAKRPLVIFAKEKNRARLAEQVGEAPKAIASVDDYVMLAKP